MENTLAGLIREVKDIRTKLENTRLREVANSYVLIDSVELTQDTDEIEFINITQRYKHLKFFIYTRIDQASTELRFQVNDVDSGYDGAINHISTTLTASNYINQTYWEVRTASSAYSTGFFVPCELTLNNYTNSDILPSFVATFGIYHGTSSGDIYTGQAFGVQRVAQSINSIRFYLGTGNIVTDSFIQMFGVK